MYRYIADSPTFLVVKSTATGTSITNIFPPILSPILSTKILNLLIVCDNKSHTKTFDILTIRVASIISIIKSAVVILVITPTSRNIPPISIHDDNMSSRGDNAIGRKRKNISC
jgi:hypothetical protein